MHSNEPPPSPASDCLVLQLGRLIVSRDGSPRRRDRLHAKLTQAGASTSQQIHSQPRFEAEEQRPAVEAQLSSHVHALWTDQIPICIEVLLAPACAECAAAARAAEAGFERLLPPRAMLLERWTIQVLPSKPHENPSLISSSWLLNAVRSQLHFSQLAAWRATLGDSGGSQHNRRKLSRESCNFKKVEANCDQEELADGKRKLNVVYFIKIPGESYKAAEFVRPPIDHVFPITDIGNNLYLKVVLESLPRIDEIPTVKCTCKRRASKEIPPNLHEELMGKLNDLTIGARSKYQEHAINSNIGSTARRLSIVSNTAATEYLYTTEDKNKMLDDRMHTPCSENGKHKCNCDDESDGKDNNKPKSQEPKKLDERRLKEIAKYKRRLRKESKLKKLCDSTSSEGDVQQKAKETHTSIPILQAARFDRFRAIGCYRNQTYLTLPASRMESKSPFVESVSIPPTDFKKTNTIATQTENLACPCGNYLELKCEDCSQNRLVRSEANYNLASLENSNGARRKCEDEGKALKKPKCDNIIDNRQCDIEDSSSVSEVISRPKLKRFPLTERLEKVVSDRYMQKDMEMLNLEKDDSVFSVPKPESKRQKTFSISEDYVLYENCDYGNFDRCENEVDSPKDYDENGFKFPDGKKGMDNQIPSPSEMDRFRWRFDSAASMVFHTKTGLPLTSSPAPLRRGNNCFDFDDSINGISGIKSALFRPSPPSAAPPTPPAPRPKRSMKGGPKVGPSTGLLGSFEESALKGRLEPVATVAGFSAELGASGAFCPPHRRLPVTVFFYAAGGAHAPYMGHINLGTSGYRVPLSGTIQVSLFNPHGTLVKMFVVLYDLTCMPPMAKTFLRQRTLYMPAGADPPKNNLHKWLRYLIHLRFMTSKSGKLYLHTDIRIIVSRKADLDTATAHSLFRPIPTNGGAADEKNDKPTEKSRPNRVFGGSSEFDSEMQSPIREIGYENQNDVSYELRSFTYAPENPKYSPR